MHHLPLFVLHRAYPVLFVIDIILLKIRIFLLCSCKQLVTNKRASQIQNDNIKPINYLYVQLLLHRFAFHSQAEVTLLCIYKIIDSVYALLN